MARNLFGFVLLLLFGLGCGLNDRKRSDKVTNEFEGVITYKLTYENYKDSSLYGDTVNVFYSHGNMLNLYNTKAPKGLKQFTYLAKENKEYMQVGNTDTLRWFDCANNSMFELLSSKETDTSRKVLGFDCKQVKFISQYKHNDITFIVYQGYTYSRSALRINSDHLKDFNFQFFNQLVDKAGSFYLYYELYIPHIGKRKFEAVKIENKKLDPAIFKVDHKKIKEFVF